MLKGLLTAAIISLFSLNAFAAFIGPGADAVEVVTVKQALQLKDDSYIALEGSLVKKTKHEHYLFKDNSGEITVEIDDKDFRGLTVTPENKLRITGEVDKDWGDTTLDVKYLQLID